MRTRLVLIFVFMFAFLLGIVSPTPASAIVRKRRVAYVKHRSTKHQVEIVGGSAAGGALIGALAGGGKGALIGGGIGAAGGAIYNHATKNKKVTQ